MSQAIHPQIIAEASVPSKFLDGVKNAEDFRDYETESRDSVKELYRINHANQTLDFVLSQKAEYGKLDKAEMSVWEAMDFLNTLVDDSDPDLALPQIVHALQTAEAIRQDAHRQSRQRAQQHRHGHEERCLRSGQGVEAGEDGRQSADEAPGRKRHQEGHGGQHQRGRRRRGGGRQ